MAEQEKKSYYSVIPANVRYDKSLSSSQKLMYSEITCLTNHMGYCWASNSYFAVLYNVDSSTVSKWITALERRGYISVKYKKEGNNITERRIQLNQGPIEINQQPIENIQGASEIIQEPIEKTSKLISKANNKDNNKNNNKRVIANSLEAKSSRGILSEKEFDNIMNL